MLKSKLPTLFLLILLSILPANTDAQNNGFGKISWEKEKIQPGLVWKHSHTQFEDTLLQNINILVVNTAKRDLAIQYDPSKNARVSTQVGGTGAIAAVNGGFFSIANGGSVTYIRTGGLIVDTDTATKWKKNVNLNGAILIGAGGEVTIMKATTNQWFESHTEYTDVLVTGPLLIENKELAALPETSLVTVRHPRTAIGKAGRRKVMIITVDGRTDQSAGLTLHELAAFMAGQKCTDAVNLDGGGSTTMWISGKPYEGVVNMPCDNKKFDHEGARAVSNIIVVK
jgi:exopolysaccharide biosynthesis protein